MGPVGRGRAARSRPGRGGCRRPGRPGEAPPSRGSAARARSQAPGALRQSLQGDRAPFRRPGGSRPVTAHCSLGSPGPTACSPWGASVPRPRLLCPRQRPLLSCPPGAGRAGRDLGRGCCGQSNFADPGSSWSRRRGVSRPLGGSLSCPWGQLRACRACATRPVPCALARGSSGPLKPLCFSGSAGSFG